VISEAISLVVNHTDLDAEMAQMVMDEMLRGKATPGQMAALMTAMRMKGETEEELLGFVRGMRAGCVRIKAPPGSIDLCGTGGDGKGTFNVSTTSAFVTAAAGIPVAKHGNRGVSSNSGSYDVLSALNIPVGQGPDRVQRCLFQTGMGFLFAPIFNPTMRNVAQVRREIGMRTLFNLLGPMVNPAGVDTQLIGVFDIAAGPMMARTLSRTGSKRIMIVNGGGMDEISICGETRIVEMEDGKVTEYSLRPGDVGLDEAEIEEVMGGGSNANARIMLSVLKGEQSPRSDMVALNAGAAIYIAGGTQDIEGGIQVAKRMLRSGKALRSLSTFSSVLMDMEEESQRQTDPSALIGRKLMPNVLRERCHSVVEALTEDLLKRDRGQLMSHLDPEILANPITLTLLVLSRLLGTENDGWTSARSYQADVRFSEAIMRQRGISVIAEYKPNSPTMSPLIAAPDLNHFLSVGERCGIAGVSVLAEDLFFGGGNALFSKARSHTTLPMIYKDFVVTEEQVSIAREVGADAVLLIARCLSHEGLDELVFHSVKNGIEPLVEIHDLRDLQKLESCQCYSKLPMVGVNARDLASLEVDLDRLSSLKRFLPADSVKVAESGVSGPHDLETLRGYDAVLIGSHFMRSMRLEMAVAEMVEGGRRLIS